MLDFEIMDKALKVAWIERLTTHSSTSWKIIPELGVKQYRGLTFLIKCQYDIKMLSLDNPPNFYHTLLAYLQELNSITTADVGNVQPENSNQWKIYFFIVLGLTKASSVSAA